MDKIITFLVYLMVMEVLFNFKIEVEKLQYLLKNILFN